MSQPDAPPSLYDKIGGRPAVESMVERFYERVVADPVLAPYFKGVSMEKLRRMQLEFFSLALGGPEEYTGRPVRHAHHGLGISLQHFRRFVDHLFETLADYPLTNDERYQIVSRINTYVDDVLGRPGAF